nr:MAG: thymidylate synthase complementing protein [Bacteriophage sp.]
MKLIKPSFEIWEQPTGLEGVYKQIERVGRVCYKSEDKITEGSAKPFVDRMIKSGHGAMLEHGTVYLQFFWAGAVCQQCNQTAPNKLLDRYAGNKYSIVHYHGNDVYVTTNLRVLVENNWLDDLKYICEPTEYHERRVTVHFVCDRGVSHEFVRHRVMSFAQESTRYCNYSKGKFGNGLTFIQPSWIILDKEIAPINELCLLSGQYDRENPNLRYLASLVDANYAYLLLLNKGWKPQEARAVLPNSLKTELVVTGFTSDWNHFFDLRARGTTGAPHPQAKELAEPLMKEFITRKYINN